MKLVILSLLATIALLVVFYGLIFLVVATKWVGSITVLFVYFMLIFCVVYMALREESK